MKHIDYYNMKLSHIEIFLAVAEYNSFTIAADKLHLTQPFISKTIQSLERDLGLYLFIRGKRKFQITPAGRQLYQEWKYMMTNLEKSISNAHLLQSGRNDRLRIGQGQLGIGRSDNYILKKLEETKDAIEGLDAFMEYDAMSSLLQRLIKDEFDAVIVSGHMKPEMQDFNFKWKVLCPSHLAIYINRKNPLSQRDCLQFSDLKEEQFIVFSTEKDHSYLNLLMNLGQEAGFRPQISCYIKNESSFSINLQLNNGIVLADTESNLANEQIKCYPLEKQNDLLVVWKEENERESLNYFLQSLCPHEMMQMSI